MRRVLLDERRLPIGVARVDAPEQRAPQTASRRHEIDADHFSGPVARLDQLRDARAELAAHARHQDARRHDLSASGRKCGNRITSRIDVFIPGTGSISEV